MSLPVLFLLYFIGAAVLVFFSIKCADYVDLLDKKSNISGAFIGGVILAAVTSLPELVTSISAIYVVDNAELIAGNVLGSNVFNLCIFAALTALSVKAYTKATVGKSHLATMICTIVADAIVAVAVVTGFGNIPVVNINVVALLILVVYFISFRFLSTDDAQNDEEDTSPLTVKQIIVRFILMALGLVGASIVVTYMTDLLQARLNLGASLAGALFLGVVTSLPELTSSVALVRHRNFNAMVGNIVGSNMFNFTIMSIADIIAGTTPVFIYSAGTMYMIVFGVLSTVMTGVSVLIRLHAKKQTTAVQVIYILLGVGIIVSYLTCMVLSA